MRRADSCQRRRCFADATHSRARTSMLGTLSIHKSRRRPPLAPLPKTATATTIFPPAILSTSERPDPETLSPEEVSRITSLVPRLLKTGQIFSRLCVCMHRCTSSHVRPLHGFHLWWAKCAEPLYILLPMPFRLRACIALDTALQTRLSLIRPYPSRQLPSLSSGFFPQTFSILVLLPRLPTG